LGLEPAAPRPTLPPAAPGSDAQRYQEEARVAQEQARRLQEILDDPQKLDQYMAQKAAREFEQGPVNALELKGVPFKGPQEAPIRVVEFSDFLCPYCRQIAGAFNAYVPQAGNRVAIYFKNYPLEQSCNPKMTQTIHPGACGLAMGAHCANDQGKFWPYHDRVFGAPPKNPQAADIVGIAKAAGLDATAFEACLNAPQTRERLAAEIAEANKLKVDATPTLFINGKRLPRTSDFLQTVEREAARLGLPPLAAAGHTGHP
jgi:protein-disulfide isomerase